MNTAAAAPPTFVFADLAGYTALNEAHGDEGGASTASRFFEITRRELSTSSRLVKTLGDGVMIVADSAPEGIRVAMAIARSVRTEPDFPAVRIGIHTGPAVEREGDFFGNCVNLTARVMAAAEPGQVLCTEPIAMVASVAGMIPPTSIGLARLKHISHPIALYELHADVGEQSPVYLDPVCRMRFGLKAVSVSIEHEGALVRFCSQTCCERFLAEPAAYLPIT